MKLWFGLVAGTMILVLAVADRSVTRWPAPVDSPAVSRIARFIPDPEAIALVRSGLEAERRGDTATARGYYLRGIDALGPIADWLRLRAAALTADSSGRASLYQAIRRPPIQALVGVTEARVRESRGDITGAIAAQTRLGQASEVLRLRLVSAPDGAARSRVLHLLVGFVDSTATAPAGMQAAAAALPYLREISASQAMTVARAATQGNTPNLAVAYFARARAGRATFTPADRVGFGDALLATGRYGESAAEFARVTNGTFTARAMLGRGRALVRASEGAKGPAILQSMLRRYPSDPVTAPLGLFLLGDAARDKGDFEGARRFWARLGERFPASEFAPRARFLTALIQWTRGRYLAAALSWDSLAHDPLGAEESIAATYWAGRAWSQLGDTMKANTHWRDIETASPLSYYVRLGARRLGRDSLPGNIFRADSFPGFGDLESDRARLELLSATGLAAEIGFETRWLASTAGAAVSRLLATADLLRRFGRASLATQLGWRAFSSGAKDDRTSRLIFPVLYGEVLVRAALGADVEPALIAALIRQESLFDSSATSRAGARGLMQIMPSVGRQLARGAGWSGWDPDSLYRPWPNLQLGSIHLAAAVRRYQTLELALAAYNAGGSRVSRWAAYPGSEDPELFVEWIPFRETRAYVRSVLRNLDFYRSLYHWPERTR